MTPSEFPLEAIYRGDTYRWRIAFWLSATVPCDLTGVTAKAEIRDRPGGSTIVALHCTVELPNLVWMELLAPVSRTLPLLGAWDLQLTYASGDVQTVLAGPVTVTADVTDSTLESVAVSAAARRVPNLPGWKG